jgi:hypothetical protein
MQVTNLPSPASSNGWETREANFYRCPSSQGAEDNPLKESDFRHLMPLMDKDPTLTARKLTVMGGLGYSIHTTERELERREVERNPAKEDGEC